MWFRLARVSFFFVFVVAISSSSYANGQGRLAIFQFNAGSMSVVGLENTVTYTIRVELGRFKNLDLLPQREMELDLTRNDIAQTFDRNEARKAAKILNVDYVLIGKVDRIGGKIIANAELISRLSDKPVANWVFSFNNQQDIELQRDEIGRQIIASIDQVESSEKIIETGSVNSWAKEFSAEASGDEVELTWKVGSSVGQPLGFNVYRAESKSGPFSYITSVLDNSYKDNVWDVDGNVYYQIALLTESGDEIRNNKTLEVERKQSQTSTIAAPIPVRFEKLFSGPELEIIPSAKNSKLAIESYQLVRKSNDDKWLVVDEVKSISQGNSLEIKHYLLKDKFLGSVRGKLEYGARAVIGGKPGHVSELFVFDVPKPPVLSTGKTPLSKQIMLFWKSVPNQQGYKLYRRAERNRDWRLISKNISPQATSFTDNDIPQNGMSFEYAISFVNQYGESALSDAVLGSTKDGLRAPDNIRIVSKDENSVTIRWDTLQDPEIIGYKIYRYNDKNANLHSLSPVEEIVWSENPTFIDKSSLNSSKAYFYFVSAVDSRGEEGRRSDIVELTPARLPAPVDSIETQFIDGDIQIAWTYSAGEAIQFMLERSQNDSRWEQLAILEANERDFKDLTAIAGHSVLYRISVIDSDILQSKTITSKIIEIP